MTGSRSCHAGVRAAGVARRCAGREPLLGLRGPRRGLGAHVHVRMWSPDDSSDPMPLLVVRDGPDYDRLAQLTPLLGRAVGAR